MTDQEKMKAIVEAFPDAKLSDFGSARWGWGVQGEDRYGREAAYYASPEDARVAAVEYIEEAIQYGCNIIEWWDIENEAREALPRGASRRETARKIVELHGWGILSLEFISEPKCGPVLIPYPGMDPGDDPSNTPNFPEGYPC